MTQRIPCIEVVDKDMAAVLRHKTDAERLEIAADMWRSARTLIRDVLRTDQPDWDEPQIQRETARRMSHGLV